MRMTRAAQAAKLASSKWQPLQSLQQLRLHSIAMACSASHAHTSWCRAAVLPCNTNPGWGPPPTSLSQSSNPYSIRHNIVADRLQRLCSGYHNNVQNHDKWRTSQSITAVHSPAERACRERLIGLHPNSIVQYMRTGAHMHACPTSKGTTPRAHTRTHARTLARTHAPRTTHAHTRTHACTRQMFAPSSHKLHKTFAFITRRGKPLMYIECTVLPSQPASQHFTSSRSIINGSS